jgi:hypothetical protein
MAETGERLEEEIERILSSTWITETPAVDPSRHTLVMRHPTLVEKQLVNFYKRQFIEGHKDKLISRKKAEQFAFINGAWHPSNDEKIDELTERFEVLQEELKEAEESAKKAVAERSRVRSLTKELGQLQYSLQALILQKNNIFINTLEFQAERDRIFRLVGLVTTDMHGEALWHEGEIAQETDVDLLEFLASDFITHQNIDITLIRKIARSNLWSYRWELGKSQPKSLFGRDVKDLSTEQSFLVFWSQLYDNIRECAEPPSPEILRDDEAFDKWLESKVEKRQVKDRKKKFNLNRRGNEQFIVIDGYYDDKGYWQEFSEEEKQRQADSVYSCNSELARRVQKSGAKKLESMGGQAQEVELRRGWFRHLGWDKTNE